ncbi:MAG: head GIN domain-containing protein [Mucilaginibacter sp.]
MKQTFYITLAAAVIAISALSSCNMSCKNGSGTMATDTRKVDDFTKIEVSGGCKVTLKQDSSLSVTLTTDDNLLGDIKTSVSGGTLKIKPEENICTEGNINIVIGVRNLEKIEGTGAVEFISDGKLIAQNFDISLSGAGKVNLDLNAAKVHTEANGATEIALRGQATSHDIEISGTGKIDALDFVVSNYNIETSGAGESKINVLKSLIVKTSGASSIQYRGNPTTIKNNESGASSVKKID